VTIPSRGRKDSLKKSIQAAHHTAKFKDNIEFLIRLDDDDEETISMFKQDAYFKTLKNLRVFVGQRVGYFYNWVLLIGLFERVKGDIIVPIADDLFISLKHWDEFFLQYKDEPVVVSYKARLVLTKKIIEQDEYVKTWTKKVPEGDTRIYKYAYRNGFHIPIKNWLKKTDPHDKTKQEGLFKGWQLEDKAVLDNLRWELLEIGQV
jgi:hypothetical protein